MTSWTLSLTSPQSLRLWAAVEALAAQYLQADSHLTVDAARADALVDLALSDVQVSTTVTLVAPLPGEVDGDLEFRAVGERVCSECSMAGGLYAGAQPDDAGCECRPGVPAMVAVRRRLRDPVEDPRLGVVLPSAVEKLLADPDVGLRLAVRHPGTGTLRYQDPTTYRPGKALAAAVRLRDGRCRFPGCRTAAERCQLDHVVPAPAGLTEASNLQCLCTTHHGFKHHAGWRVTMDGQGFCTWTAPTGRRHHTAPRDFGFQAA